MINKRKVILTLSKVFPATHPKAGAPTGFEEKFKSGVKLHTIRADKKGIWSKWFEDIKAGRKYLSIREWTGRPYNSEQREYARLDKIGIQEIEVVKNIVDPLPTIWIDNEPVPVEEVAKNDGLSVQDFIDWFFVKDKDIVFKGKIIHFTEFRYNEKSQS